MNVTLLFYCSTLTPACKTTRNHDTGKSGASKSSETAATACASKLELVRPTVDPSTLQTIDPIAEAEYLADYQQLYVGGLLDPNSDSIMYYRIVEKASGVTAFEDAAPYNAVRVPFLKAGSYQISIASCVDPERVEGPLKSKLKAAPTPTAAGYIAPFDIYCGALQVAKDRQGSPVYIQKSNANREAGSLLTEAFKKREEIEQLAMHTYNEAHSYHMNQQRSENDQTAAGYLSEMAQDVNAHGKHGFAMLVVADFEENAGRTSEAAGAQRKGQDQARLALMSGANGCPSEGQWENMDVQDATSLNLANWTGPGMPQEEEKKLGTWEDQNTQAIAGMAILATGTVVAMGSGAYWLLKSDANEKIQSKTALSDYEIEKNGVAADFQEGKIDASAARIKIATVEKRYFMRTIMNKVNAEANIFLNEIADFKGLDEKNRDFLVELRKQLETPLDDHLKGLDNERQYATITSENDWNNRFSDPDAIKKKDAAIAANRMVLQELEENYKKAVFTDENEKFKNRAKIFEARAESIILAEEKVISQTMNSYSFDLKGLKVTPPTTPIAPKNAKTFGKFMHSGAFKVGAIGVLAAMAGGVLIATALTEEDPSPERKLLEVATADGRKILAALRRIEEIHAKLSSSLSR